MTRAGSVNANDCDYSDLCINCEWFIVGKDIILEVKTQRARDAGGGLWRPSRVARRMHATNSLTVRRDGSMTSTIALHHELRLPLLLGLLDNQSHNHEQMDVFHLLLG
jgi:hypothetical protein